MQEAPYRREATTARPHDLSDPRMCGLGGAGGAGLLSPSPSFSCCALPCRVGYVALPNAAARAIHRRAFVCTARGHGAASYSTMTEAVSSLQS
jgi:hypothetical protein